MYLSVFMVKDNYGKFQNVANALVEDKLSSIQPTLSIVTHLGQPIYRDYKEV
jgi:hypothetical protein